MAASQSTNPSQAPGLNTNGATGQATGLQPQQPQQPQASNDTGDDWLISNDKHGLLAWTDPNLTITKNQSIQQAWGIVLAMADLFLVLFIMINGIRIAMGGMGFRYAEALEALPRILLAFAAANLSQLFIANLIELNNDLCLGILSAIGNNNLVYAGGVTGTSLITRVITLGITLLGGLFANFIPFVGQLLSAASWLLFAGNLILLLIDGTLWLLYLFLAVQLVIRLALINLLTIMAPLGLACWALPQGAGQQLMRIWLNATFASIMVQFLQLTAYVFGVLLFVPIGGLTKLSAASFFGINPSQLTQFDPGIFFKIAVVWFALRVPGLVQNVATQTMGEGSRNMASTISQAVGAGLSVVSTTVIALR